ncbi:DMT family transporter [Legionella spiritensis]|uniref:Transmembrane protein n=1 Tax=Legionella spiritensis TaxID=452 RepID=A0A0W0ZAE3_LEGSP|nr:EamA family transporter [Legionella spiritensis]KTD66091.1 transmembrane protein [Legionella spiritensis]SNV44240.1 Aromatic amino acid exporter YddG [Legionella spiritensis]
MQILRHPTLIGYVALLFWMVAGPFTAAVKSIPLFEVLSITFFISFLLSAGKLTVRKQWKKIKQPWVLYLIIFAGIYINQILYVSSFKFAPAAHADLINYLWPVLISLLAGFLPNERLSIKHIIAACLGFAGVYTLLGQGHHGFGFDTHYLLGYVLAFLGALIWSLYCLTSRHFENAPVEIIGMCCGVAAFCSLIAHLSLETTITLHARQWVILMLMGITTQGLAYFFWDIGVKNGNFKLLGLLSYGNPVLSILVLIALDMAKPSIELLIACILVTTGGLIGIIPWTRLTQNCFRFRRHLNVLPAVESGWPPKHPPGR